MDLETIEQTCLEYLKQVSNPVVTLGALFGRVKQNIDECPEISREDFLAFLRAHELFTVIEAPDWSSNAEMKGVFESAGISSEERVILCTRVPPAGELSSMMKEQLELIHRSLAASISETSQDGDDANAGKLLQLLEQTQKLMESTDQFC